MSSGTDKPEKVRFDLSQLCEEVAQRYEAVCAQNGYTLKLELPDPERLPKKYSNRSLGS